MDNKVLLNITQQCKFLLDNYYGAEACKQYLDSRLEEVTQKYFDFGYFPDHQNISALNSLIGASTLNENDLAYYKTLEDALGMRRIQFSFFEHYPVVLPFRDVYGTVIALVGRTLAEAEERERLGIPKYKNTIFSKSNHLFGLFENKKEILRQDRAYLVEGQFDVIKAYERGLRNVVAVGSSNLSANQFSLLCRYTNNIFLLFDNDEAGIKGRERAVKKYGDKANIRNFYLPEDYKDLDEFFGKNLLQDLTLSTTL